MNLRSITAALAEQFDRRPWLVVPIAFAAGVLLAVIFKACAAADRMQRIRVILARVKAGPVDDQVDDELDEVPPRAPRRRKAKATPADAPQDVPPAPAGDQVPS